MPDSILEQARKKRQTRTAIAWIGGCGFFCLLAILQTVLLVSWSQKRLVRTQHPVHPAHPTLPAWVPVYPGSEPKGDGGAKEGQVALQTQDPPDRVLDFYTERLRANGFAVAPRKDEAEVYTLEGRRPDGSQVTVQSGTGLSPPQTWIIVMYKTGMPGSPAV